MFKRYIESYGCSAVYSEDKDDIICYLSVSIIRDKNPVFQTFESIPASTILGDESDIERKAFNKSRKLWCAARKFLKDDEKMLIALKENYDPKQDVLKLTLVDEWDLKETCVNI